MFVSADLTKPVDGAADAAGENAEYDPLYMELESFSSAEDKDPDYRKLEKSCLELWKKTRDLRVAAYLCVAETELNGLAGLAEGLAVVRWLVDEMWADFYPRLDPDDDNDPLERLNILAMLSPEPGAFNDPVMFLSRLRQVRLLPSLPYTMRDAMIANGELESDRSVDPKLIAAEMMGRPIDEIKAQADLVAKIDGEVSALCAGMDEKMRGAYFLNMSSLQKELKRFSTFYQKHLDSFGSAGDAEPAPSDPVGEPAEAAAPVAVKRGGAVDLGSVRATSRAEALLLLKKGAEYFEAEEPTSPVPYLVKRALRLSEMNFMDLLADIAPDALPRGRDILGVQQSGEDGEQF